MSLQQISVLLLFNNCEELSLSDISNQTNLTGSDLGKIIQSLIEVGILLQNDCESPICLNINFSSKKTKIKLPMTTLSSENPDPENMKKSIDDDRSLYLQAIIVRIMKAQKRLIHNLLVSQAIELSKSRFYPSVSLIKKCIDILLDKSYIERDSNNRDEYIYLV